MTIADTVLASLENDGECLRYHAADLERHVALLTTMPEFPTRAEANLERAQAALKQATAAVESALKRARKTRRSVKLVAAE